MFLHIIVSCYVDWPSDRPITLFNRCSGVALNLVCVVSYTFWLCRNSQHNDNAQALPVARATDQDLLALAQEAEQVWLTCLLCRGKDVIGLWQCRPFQSIHNTIQAKTSPFSIMALRVGIQDRSKTSPRVMLKSKLFRLLPSCCSATQLQPVAARRKLLARCEIMTHPVLIA